MAAPSVTYTFTNGTTSDATQVNTNFTDLIDCISDGTTDFTIGSLSVAGNANLNGNVTLGNSSADDITFTGSLAATIPVKVTATYNFGSATTGLLSVYYGNGSFTTRVMAGTLTASWTLTLPVASPGVTGKGMVFDSNGLAEFRYPEKFTASKTGDYTATGDETIISCAPSASMTVTLPAASTMTGKTLTILKTDTDTTKTVTIDANSSETILPSVQASNLTYILYTQYESVTLKCDGSNWYVISSYTKTAWASYTPSFSNLGTQANVVFKWRRNGPQLEVIGSADFAGAPAGSAASMSTPNTSVIASNFQAAQYIKFGTATANETFSGGLIPVIARAGDSVVAFGTPSGTALTPINGSAMSDGSRTFSFEFSIPITGWNP